MSTTKPRRPSNTTRRRLTRKAAESATLNGDLATAAKLLKREAIHPIPATMIGPAKGKNGNGRPRTGNKSLSMQVDTNGKLTGEIGASHAHLDHAYNRFLEGIKEPDLLQALAVAPGPDSLRKNKYQQALLMLTHPAYVKHSRRGTGLPGEWSIASIMKRTGITLQDLMDVYGRYRTAQAIRIAMDRSPTIITHAADDAENRKVVCPRCDGLGTLDLDAVAEETSEKRRKAVVRTCPECKGSGEVTQSGDAEARKLVLEVAGIAGKKGPVVDARSVHYGNGTFSVESLVKGMEQLEAPEDVIDIESEPLEQSIES